MTCGDVRTPPVRLLISEAAVVGSDTSIVVVKSAKTSETEAILPDTAAATMEAAAAISLDTAAAITEEAESPSKTTALGMSVTLVNALEIVGTLIETLETAGRLIEVLDSEGTPIETLETAGRLIEVLDSEGTPVEVLGSVGTLIDTPEGVSRALMGATKFTKAEGLIMPFTALKGAARLSTGEGVAALPVDVAAREGSLPPSSWKAGSRGFGMFP